MSNRFGVFFSSRFGVESTFRFFGVITVGELGCDLFLPISSLPISSLYDLHRVMGLWALFLVYLL